MLTYYTSYDQVRAILSVTDEELEDHTLALPVFEYNLHQQFVDAGEGLHEKYLALMAANSTSWTANERRYVNIAQVFATYGVAVQLLDSLPLLAVQSEQDARAQYQRFEKPFERVDAAVRSAFQVAKANLVRVYNLIAATPLNSQPTLRRFSGSAGLPLDPVTNA